MYNTIEEVENWLIKMNIKNYVINDDLTVDVNDNVNLSYKELKEIPIKFGIVDGKFDCGGNELTSLKCCPNKVKGHFYCDNNQITSLEFCPKEVSGNFNCYCNKLTNLEGCPEVINNDFNCSYNDLTSLEYFPKKINGKFIRMEKNDIKEEELFNFNCDIKNVIYIYSDFNESEDKENFLEKVNYYKSKKENELLKELSINSNIIKLNKKL